jgi:hypothetical protein
MARDSSQPSHIDHRSLADHNSDSLDETRRRSTVFDLETFTLDQLNQDIEQRVEALNGLVTYQGRGYDKDALPQAMLDNPPLADAMFQALLVGMVVVEQRDELFERLEIVQDRVDRQRDQTRNWKAKFAELVDLRPKTPSSQGQATPPAVPATQPKRKALPDPESLTDGKTPDFETWEIKMREKLRRDAADYPDPADQLGYIFSVRPARLPRR